MRIYQTIPLFIIAFCNAFSLFAQGDKRDSLFSQNLQEVVITATRTERKLGNVGVPVTLISQKTIQQSGSLRLNDILQEQTGLIVTGGTGSNAVGGGVFGNGIQMQGLSPDHTIILLDGEPLIGRQGGVMDLSRFAVGNIRKIEIVRGPSSSLYGSEAMGGVVNIITEPVQGKTNRFSLRTGSFGQSDIVASGSFADKSSGIYYFGNFNSSQGYDLDPSRIEKTQDPFRNLTAQAKIWFSLSPHTKLTISNRFFQSEQESYYAVNSKDINVGGKGVVSDFYMNPVLTHKFNERTSTQLRLVMSEYRFTQDLELLSDKSSYYFDDFKQGFYRAENQTDITLSKSMQLTLGGGFTKNTIATTRYKDRQEQNAWHTFTQLEASIGKKIILIQGIRYDYNTSFEPSISPKISLSYKPLKALGISASAGRGFKAPDFRQLYLNFTNIAGDGYSIFGANEFSVSSLESQLQEGLIAAVLPAAYSIRSLRPETSTGMNLGLTYRFPFHLHVDVNLFRNDIDNLINYLPVATNNNGTPVFSYLNINRSFTQGIETGVRYTFKNIEIAAGYQYLITGDKDLIQKIERGEVFGRDEVLGSARRMKMSDYSGLLNRSKHLAHCKVFYNHEATGWNASLRCIYRSRFGVLDLDGNGFANMDDEFAPYFFQVNTTVGKKINQKISAQVGVNNLFNQINARWMPNIPGINWFLSMQIQLSHKTKSQ
ncbi:MAG: TonB-dependent receptor plug domain-containing protein [Bacteroidota bacterium]